MENVRHSLLRRRGFDVLFEGRQDIYLNEGNDKLGDLDVCFKIRDGQDFGRAYITGRSQVLHCSDETLIKDSCSGKATGDVDAGGFVVFEEVTSQVANFTKNVRPDELKIDVKRRMYEAICDGSACTRNADGTRVAFATPTNALVVFHFHGADQEALPEWSRHGEAIIKGFRVPGLPFLVIHTSLDVLMQYDKDEAVEEVRAEKEAALAEKDAEIAAMRALLESAGLSFD